MLNHLFPALEIGETQFNRDKNLANRAGETIFEKEKQLDE